MKVGQIFECAWPSWESKASGPDVKVEPGSVIMRGPRTLKGSKDPYIFLESLGRPEVMVCDVTGVPPDMER